MTIEISPYWIIGLLMLAGFMLAMGLFHKDNY